MGTWSAQPFGNDSAADWAWELDQCFDWSIVRNALADALKSDNLVEADVACTAIAAAEVVAHGLGRPTESDAYTEDVTAFVVRIAPPPAELVDLAISALAAASGVTSELTELWNESDAEEWCNANALLQESLRG